MPEKERRDDIEVRHIFFDRPPQVPYAMLQGIRSLWWLWGFVLVLFMITNFNAILEVVDPVPLYYPALPHTVMNRQVHHGEGVVSVAVRCNRTQEPLTYVSHRVFVRADSAGHGERVDLPSLTLTAPPGCTTTAGTSVVIPPDMDPGIWTIEGVVSGTSRFRSWMTQYYTEPFEVVP